MYRSMSAFAILHQVTMQRIAKNSPFGYSKLLFKARSKRLLNTIAWIALLKQNKCSRTRSFCPGRLAKVRDASR